LSSLVLANLLVHKIIASRRASLSPFSPSVLGGIRGQANDLAWRTLPLAKGQLG